MSEQSFQEQSFEQFWTAYAAKAFGAACGGPTGALANAFREVASEAWNHGFDQGYAADSAGIDVYD